MGLLIALAAKAGENGDDRESEIETDDQSRQSQAPMLATPRYDRSALKLARELAARSDQQARIDTVMKYVAEQAPPQIAPFSSGRRAHGVGKLLQSTRLLAILATQKR